MAPTLPAAALTIWMTGLPCSGKTTLAGRLRDRLAADGALVRVLDGDHLRQGLSRDLGFSAADRTENIRRVAEVARLFNEVGVTVISALVSPMRSDRAMARAIVGADRFLEVYLDAPRTICEARDVKGMYALARKGRIAGFTGVDAPYEAPESAHCVLDTGRATPEDCLEQLRGCLARHAPGR